MDNYRMRNDATPPHASGKFVCNSGTKKKFVCTFPECGKFFSRSEHLHRHGLNHKDGNNTCLRCMAHFCRRDLLDRHMIRHKEKDDEAGGEGLGVLATRKRLWRDANGKIVKSRRPCHTQDKTKRHQTYRQGKKFLNPVTILEEASFIAPHDSIANECVRLEAELLSQCKSEVDLQNSLLDSNEKSSEIFEKSNCDSWLNFCPELPELFDSVQAIGNQPECPSSPNWASKKFQTFMGATEDIPFEDMLKHNTEVYSCQTWENDLVMPKYPEGNDTFGDRWTPWSLSPTDEIFQRGYI